MHLKFLIGLLVGLAVCIAIIAALTRDGAVAAAPDTRLTNVGALTIYDIQVPDPAGRVVYETKDASKAVFDGEKVQAVLADAEYIAWEPRWKGGFLAVAHLEGEHGEIMLAISHYGGFFKVIGQDGHYRMNEESRAYMETALKAALVEVFLPARDPGQANDIR